MKSNYTYTKLSCYIGYIVQAIVNNFLPILFIALQDVYKLGYEKLARLIVFNFVTQMITDIITPKILRVLSYKQTVIMAHFCAAFGLAMLGILPDIVANSYLAIIISIIVYAFGSGLIEVVVSPIVDMLPTTDKAGNMAFLHSFYCWGQAFTIIITTVMVLSFGYTKWNYIPLLWATVPFLNMFFFAKVPVVEPDKEEKEIGFLKLISQRKFFLFMIMMLCAGACEIAMAEWASLFAQQALGVSKIVGDLTGPCLFAIFMGLGRVWYGIKAQNISFRKTLICLSIACFVCYAVVAVSNIPVVSLVFCALCGFTVSISWPGIYSAGAKKFKNVKTTMFSVFAMCGDTGCCLGPWIVGIVADKTNLNTGFGVAAIFPVIMITTTLLTLKKHS